MENAIAPGEQAVWRRGLLLALGVGLAGPVAALADSVTIDYYTISATDPDANHLSGGVVNNEVQNLLGPDGLPVLNIGRLRLPERLFFPDARTGEPRNERCGCR